MDVMPELTRDVLMSIRPLHASKILTGQKTVELRRKFPELTTKGAIALIYSSSPVGAVVGYARIKRVIKLPVPRIWKEHGSAACISKDEFDSYFAGLAYGFAILLESVRPLKKRVRAPIRKFCVPIRPDYHHRLFPEIAFPSDLPLFPREAFGPMIAYGGQERTPGNTIRKVYLCRAKITRLRPSDILFFYMSKDDRYALSQSITTIGVVEQVVSVTTTDDLIRHTAKRSVFSAQDLDAMRATRNSPVKLIDFLLIGHVQAPVRLNTLIQMGVFSHRPPQSIAQFTEERYIRLKPHVQLAFDL
jgi:predicted transcriptional regulator